MKSAFNRALLFHILNASRYDPRDRRFYYAVATALTLFGVAVVMVIFFMS